MNGYRIVILPCSAFGSEPLGDMLFGQLCWTVRNRYGEDRLRNLLEGYTGNRPFAVMSDALPSGYLPRPALPGHWFESAPDQDRKSAKKRVWMPLNLAATTPVAEWPRHCQTPAEIPGAIPREHSQPHNSIHRQTGTTGEGRQFVPYAMNQLWYGDDAELDIYVVLDDARLNAQELETLFNDMGAFGFGRDASAGLGKFRVKSLEPFSWPEPLSADAWLTLAPCAPQGLGFDASRSFYRVFTRFGRHGDMGVHQGHPFKTPVLLAQTGAVLTPTADGKGPAERTRLFLGQGLGGDGQLSRSLPATVHQGYAPVIGIQLPRREAAV
ncbi:type III-A CRISPR-associated RAMP protein Csm4 [Methylococcus geothermalis]|uniref:CRISPR system Cms protein Csm4 n=1 Tax=Methylococcus geothermalis TaxID=2681310 RepID=A0A858Q9A5_9GAMM|nr:CRISPR-associated protein Csm7 [Methylococcus geothermalis]QJD30449.1 CRISPR-associated protein Csm7 [Methylococcus geothermalis]